ncbi:MAG TPA: PIG-L deacetylase family protein [Streptosporangiaceae bacterium]|nr:PIG-L deacetylase family protein [Streptosporangiaceae bacterium]
MLLDDAAQRVLVVVAHPDDADFWVGGTVARWTGAGVEVSYCVLTDGEGAVVDRRIPWHEVGGLRRSEQQRAAALLGVKTVRFLGLREDGVGSDPHGVREELVRVVRDVRPDRVVTWSPESGWRRFLSRHPDHVATGAAVLTAVCPAASGASAQADAGDNEGPGPWAVQEVWLFDSSRRKVNYYVDITETFDRKVAAVRAHVSQIRNPDQLADRLRRRIAPNTAAAGSAAGRLAEAFQVLLTG